MNLDISHDWLLKMAASEANNRINIGGLVARLISAERALEATEDVIAIAEMSPEFDMPNVNAYAAITVAKELASEHRRLLTPAIDSPVLPLSIEVAAGFAGEEVDCG